MSDDIPIGAKVELKMNGLSVAVGRVLKLKRNSKGKIVFAWIKRNDKESISVRSRTLEVLTW